MSAKLYTEVVDTLRQRKTNLCCNDVKDLLHQLGFEVRDGKRGGHKVFTHDGLPSFTSGSFNCGHGKNPEIKPAYITKIIRTLQIYEAELSQYLSER
ncbi:type II toxin-antitoxin system HicA family toxin [Salinimonas sp. HHU 13199]|uniref:Type II toxin-antitoxin system HicA family toxin n=1 Tax=Salinimonas profundi TaxID=2729140 RepID=A0ABR8LQU6_9ALTE|nr:type II toxin-antitoxin system HicA family toxin [Salinimonas profundi]MBD3587436.1 type II toxin-antitoxin system HicA family toxin [Salinimonas profundi]